MDGKVGAYRRVDTEGKSQLELIVQVYDGAIDSMRKAGGHYRNEQWQPGYDELERSRRFLTHLYTTLNHEKGGDIAKELGKLYAWVINQINVAQGTKDLAVIDDSISILTNLREGWLGLKEQQASEKPTAQPEPTGADKGSFVHSA